MKEIDVSYLGEKELLSRTQSKYTGLSFETLNTYEKIEEHLSYLKKLYEIGLNAGIIRTKVEREIGYAALYLIEPHISKSDADKERIYFGPGTVMNLNENLAIAKAYLVVNDKEYDGNEMNLKGFCTKNKIPVIKESELEHKVKNLIEKAVDRVNQSVSEWKS